MLNGGAREGVMSALGQKQTSRHVRVISVIPLKADIHQREWHIRYVPLADVIGPVALLVSSIATPQRASCRLPLRTASTTSRIESITS